MIENCSSCSKEEEKMTTVLFVSSTVSRPEDEDTPIKLEANESKLLCKECFIKFQITQQHK
jgi:hypothetical protein